MIESTYIREELFEQECREIEQIYRTIDSGIHACEQEIRDLTDKRKGFEQSYRYFCEKLPGHREVETDQAPFFSDIENKINENEECARQQRKLLEGKNDKESVFIHALLDGRIVQAETELLSPACRMSDDYYRIKYYYGCFKSRKERNEDSLELFRLCEQSEDYWAKAGFAGLVMEIEEYEEQTTLYYNKIDHIVDEFSTLNGDQKEVRTHGGEYLKNGREWIDRGEQLKSRLREREQTAYTDRLFAVIDHQIRQVTSSCNAFESVRSINRMEVGRRRRRMIHKVVAAFIAILIICWFVFR
jgi:hypothetical protein